VLAGYANSLLTTILVSCGHFKSLIKNSPPITLDIYKRPYQIAAMLRQTSKWVKNTFVLMNIFHHIDEEWGGVPSESFSDWISFYEIGPKTGALIFHAAFGKMMTLPVDSHVWHAFRKGGWTNGWILHILSQQMMLLVPHAKH
jgi:endonuclease III